MSFQGKSGNRAIAAMLAIVALAAAFWMLLLAPEREEAAEAAERVERLESSLAQHEAEVAEAEAARREFPAEYQRLVVLGKAVPADDDIASLLVQVNRIGESAGGSFREIELTAAGGEASPAPPAAGGGTVVSATEVAASLLPLGATIGPAGLAVMPYEISFEGDFFQIADFIAGLDRLVETDGQKVAVDGRLVTIDGFALTADPVEGFPKLEADFAFTTYLTPPADQVGGATPGGPGPAPATPAATTTGGAP